MPHVSRVQRRRRRDESGFTLIELLVVIAILGVLAGIVIFNVTGVSDRGQLAACRTEVSTIQQALDTYRNSPTTANPPGSSTNGNPGVPPAGGVNALSPGFLHTRPTSCMPNSYFIDPNGTVRATANNPTHTTVP
jgi:prepilin-type N-terminal cleavage/methylation domain-containing protein